MTSCIFPNKMTTEVEDKMTTTEIDVTKYIEEPHTIIDACFNGRHLQRLIEHQIESYNDFIQHQVPRTISMFNPVHICSEQDLDKATGKYRLEMFVTCENFNIYRAQIHELNGATKSMFPQEARDCLLCSNPAFVFWSNTSIYPITLRANAVWIQAATLL